MADVTRPRVEGTIGLSDRRRLGFAEFGPPDGRAIVWLHGTPGARRQVPSEARAKAEEHGLRIVGIDRPGIGSSSPPPPASTRSTGAWSRSASTSNRCCLGCGCRSA